MAKIFILLVFIEGGFSQEFSSQAACEAARKQFLDGLATGGLYSIAPIHRMRAEKSILCVPK